MQYIINYRSSRQQVWNLYWKLWVKQLWKTHFELALLFTFLWYSISFIKSAELNYWYFILIFVASLILIAFLFAIIPQLKFKNSERILAINASGLKTIIGKKSGTRTWDEIHSLKEDKGKIIITGHNGNAFIIPEYAFTDSSERQQFIDDARQWKKAFNG